MAYINYSDVLYLVHCSGNVIINFLPTDPEDYIARPFPLVFTSTTDQNTPVCASVGIINDNLDEEDETFLIQLSIQSGETQVILNPLIGTATIIDDDGNSCICLLLTDCRLCNDMEVFIIIYPMNDVRYLNYYSYRQYED